MIPDESFISMRIIIKQVILQKNETRMNERK